MPRIDSIRLARWLWVSFSVNDWGEYKAARFGFTQYQSWRRSIAALEAEEGR